MRRTLAAAALLLAATAARGQEAASPKPDPRADRVAAYEKGLAWLRTQAKDGTFGGPGLTGLALVALQGRPGGTDPKDAALVEKGLASLVALQKPDGGIYEDQLGTYNTSLAVQALVASKRKDLQPVVEKALGFLRRAQYGEEGAVAGMKVARSDERYGGMGYGSDPNRPDLSNTYFALESLRAAGVPESDPAFQRALAYAQRLQNRRENETEGEPKEWKDEQGHSVVRGGDGGSNYRPGESKAGTFARPDGKRELRSYGSMTYALLKCYLFAGLKRDDPRLADAVKWIRAHYTWKENPGFVDEGKKEGAQGLYYYYATAARALALLGPEAADGPLANWKDDLAATLVSLQKGDGSWVNENGRWQEGLPLIPTCFALQALAETLR